MAWLVVAGGALMSSGGLLVLLQRRRPTRWPVWSQARVAALGRFGPVFDHIGLIDDATAHLERAVDAVVLPRQGDGGPPRREDVTAAFAIASERLSEFSRLYLRRPPSHAVAQFAALIENLGGLLDDHEDPYAAELTAVDAAVRLSHRGPDELVSYDKAVARYADERRRRVETARWVVLRRLDAVGHALRWDRRRLPSATAQTRADLEAVFRELEGGVAGYVDALRPMTLARSLRGARPALNGRDRTVLALRIAEMEREIAAAAAILARGAPLEALRTLSAVALPPIAGRAADAELKTACEAAAAGLRVVAARREAALGELVAFSAAAVDRALYLLHDALAADAAQRRREHRAAFDAVAAAAECPREASGGDTRSTTIPLYPMPPIPSPRTPLDATTADVRSAHPG
jgi:hypothetical protein